METYLSRPKEDLQAIREIMERSSKFLSLSGLSGVFAGACALIGATVAWFFVLDSGRIPFVNYLLSPDGFSTGETGFFLALDALLVLVSALFGAVFFSHRKARKAGHQLWTTTARRLVFHLSIPLASGGIFILILALHHVLVLVPSVMLIFYGLSLVNAGKFTLSEIHYLGMTQIALGILAGLFVNFGLLLWVAGFGLMHVFYGTLMYYRHERKK